MATDGKAAIVLTATDKTGAAFASAKRSILGLQSSAAGISAVLGPILGGVGLIASALSLLNFKSIVNGVDALNDLKDATGASIENLSALEDVAARTGTEFAAVGTALVKFNAQLKEAKPGSGPAEVLKAIGLEAENLKRLDPAEALRQTAVALAGYADDGNKARIVQELFGKSVREVAPFLVDLAAQGKLNATVTTAQADAAEKFNHQVSTLEKNIKDAARSIVGDMIPALNDFFAALEANKRSGGVFAGIGKQIDANLASDRLRVVVGELTSLQSVIDKKGPTPFLLKNLAALNAEADALTKQAIQAGDALKGFADKGKPPTLAADYGNEGRNFLKPSAPDVPGKADTTRPGGARSERVSEAESYIESLRKQLEGTRDLSTVEKVLADIEAKRIKDINASSAGRAIDLAQQIDASIERTKLLAEEQRSREAGAQLTQRNLQAAAQEAAQLIEGNAALRDEIEIIGAGEQARRNIEQARLSSAIALKEDTLAMLQNGGAAAAEVQLLEQQIALLRQRGQLLGKINAATDLSKILDIQTANAERFADILARGAGDATVNFGNLRNVIDSVGQQLLQLATQIMVIEPLKKSLLEFLKPSGGAAGGAGTGGGGIGSLIASLFGFEGGGYTGSAGTRTPAGVVHGQEFVFSAPAVRSLGVEALSNLHAFAKGGSVPSLTRGYSDGGYVQAAPSTGPRQVMEVSVVNHFSVQGSVSRETQGQIAAKAGRAIEGAMRRATA